MKSVQELKSEAKKEYKYIGRKTKVREDVSLIQGKGHYLDDIEIPGTLYMAYVTSTYGHAKIKRIEKTAVPSMVN